MTIDMPETPDEKRAWVEEWLNELNPEAIYFDGLEDAIVGYAQQFSGDPLVVYSFDQIIKILTSEDMTEEEARDHFGFNIQGTWAGPGTPLILYSIPGVLLSVPDLPVQEHDGGEELREVPPLRDGEPHG